MGLPSDVMLGGGGVQAAEAYLPAVLPPGARSSPDDRVLTCLACCSHLQVRLPI